MGMYRATLVGNQDGQTINLVTGWTTSSATSSADANTLAERNYTGYTSFFNPITVDDLEWTGCHVIGVDDGSVVGSHTHSSTGDSTTTPLPMFVVANVKLSTGIRGRSFQGRFGVPGLDIFQVNADDGNLVSDAALADLQSALGDYIDHVNTGVPSFELAVISTISGGTPRVTPIATAVTVAAVQQPFGSRVSRKD